LLGGSHSSCPSAPTWMDGEASHVRLACVKHIASVRSEPGSNSFWPDLPSPMRESFVGVGKALGHPSPLSALPRAILYARSTKIERFRGKPAISDLGWPFTPSHESSPYFATYVGSVLQGLLELSSTCSWLDRSVSGQIVTTGIFPGWKAPTPNGLSRCSHLLADPLCKRYA